MNQTTTNDKYSLAERLKRVKKLAGYVSPS